jgi:hypothetical protein
MDDFRVLVCGSRYFDDYSSLCRWLDHLLKRVLNTHRVIIIHGACRGADTLAESYARSRGLFVEAYPADWDRYGRSAGPKRNAKMIGIANAVVAFWDGNSVGTRDTIERAKQKGIPLRIVGGSGESPDSLPKDVRDTIGN